MANFGRCQLHIPHKEWIKDSRDNEEVAAYYERENWSAVERWANNVLPGCVGCPCFFEHKTFEDSAVPLNDYYKPTLTTALTVGDRTGWDDARSSMLVVNWTVLLQDYSDGTMTVDQGIGYGCHALQNDQFIGGSHGFVTIGEFVTSGGNPWMNQIANLPAGSEFPDALTSGSFTTFLNQKVAGPFPARWTFDIAVFLGLYSAGASTGTFRGDTYEYGLCSCNAQE